MIMNQMVGVIGLENLVVNHSVSPESILKSAKRAMHKELMNRPFKK